MPYDNQHDADGCNGCIIWVIILGVTMYFAIYLMVEAFKHYQP